MALDHRYDDKIIHAYSQHADFPMLRICAGHVIKGQLSSGLVQIGV